MTVSLKSLPALALLGALALSGCGNLARNAVDNTPVNALPLASAELSGSLTEGGATGLVAQGLTSGQLAFNGTFDDLDTSSIPGIVGNPSGLDIPLQIQSLSLSNCLNGVTPNSNSITVTIKSISLTVKDANVPGGKSKTQSGLNIQFTMAKTAPGQYGASGTPTNLYTLNADWLTFAPIVAKNGANTPNTANLTIGLSLDSGNGVSPYSCQAVMKLPANLQQYVRFQ